jgi:uncharacterized Tic20 family protein
MTEPPRPPGEGDPSDPTVPHNPYPANDPAPGSAPPPAYGSPQPPTYGTSQPPPYAPPPTSGAGGYGPPPGSGAGGYGPPPGSGAGGYGTPPPGYGPQYGYGAPGSSGFATEDDKTWALIAHFGGAILAFISGGWLGWVPPLIALLAKGSQSPTVRQHATQALNFQLLWAIVALAITVVSTCLSIIVIGVLGFFLLVVPWLMGTIFGIIAGVKALNGEPYRYPGAPNWVK